MLVRRVRNGELSFFTDEDYLEGIDAIKELIVSRLSILKDDIWYLYGFGLDLKNIKSKEYLESYLVEQILDIKGVLSINNLEINYDENNKIYNISLNAKTEYTQDKPGDNIDLHLNNNIL